VRILICYIFGRRPKGGGGHGPSGPMVNTPVHGAGGIQPLSERPTGFLQCFDTVGLVMTSKNRPRYIMCLVGR